MDDSRITLAELQELIGQTIHSGLSSNFWVSAEISELKVNYSGHNYLELIEKKKDSQISARIRAIIWSRQARFLLPFFKTSTGIDLEDGISVLVKGKLEYHPLYGISLIIIDIDPRFTIGDLAKKRNDILNKLRSEGVIDMNKELNLPIHPRRVAVVSSGEAAGYQDFSDHLLNNSFGYKYELELFRAVMQGVDTERSILDALSRISESTSKYDIVVVVRGGGSQADLSWFDNYEIAYLITQFPLPIISGIGHDKDISVTDIVAHTFCKTPTAVADFIVDLTSETENFMLNLGMEITKSAQTLLDINKSKIRNMGNKLSSTSILTLSSRRMGLEHTGELINSGARRLIQSKYLKLLSLSEKTLTEPKKLLLNLNKRIFNINRSIEHLSPDKVLKRGYSITLLNGKSLKDTSKLVEGDKISTIVQKGRIESEVFDIKE